MFLDYKIMEYAELMATQPFQLLKLSLLLTIVRLKSGELQREIDICNGDEKKS